MGLVEDDTIFYLVLNNGNNMFNDVSIKKWHKMLDRIESTKGPAVLVTIATGDRIFSTGFDLQYWAKEPQNPFKSLPKFQQILARLMTLPIPSIAVINGHAFAAGLQITLAHDFRIMADGRGKLGLIELKMGIPLMAPFSALINSTLPIQTCRKLHYGYSYSAIEALKDQIVSDLYKNEEELTAKIQAFAEQFAPMGQYRKSINNNKKYLFKETLQIMERECFGPESLPQVFKAMDLLQGMQSAKL